MRGSRAIFRCRPQAEVQLIEMTSPKLPFSSCADAQAIAEVLVPAHLSGTNLVYRWEPWRARQTPHSAGRRMGGTSGGSCRDASS